MKPQTSRIVQDLYMYVCGSSLISCHLVLNYEVEDKVVCFLQKVAWAIFTSCKRDAPPGSRSRQSVPPVTRDRCPPSVFSTRLLIKIPLASYRSKFKVHVFGLHPHPGGSEIGQERSTLSSDSPLLLLGHTRVYPAPCGHVTATWGQREAAEERTEGGGGGTLQGCGQEWSAALL